ncbi:MAG: RNA polymerase sigma factor [Cyanothece sp. SIO1E1]|nr:RNA polymerase sigma factor [Cyanothece sp. SIO1E1]
MKRVFKEEEMIHGIRQGGSSLEEVLVFIYHQSGYRQSILQFIQRRNGSLEDAEDIFQEGIIRMVISIQKGKFEGKSTVRTYLTTICKNLWFTQYSRSSRYAEIVEQIPAEEEFELGPDELLLLKERSEGLQNMLSQVGEKCKKILSLWALHYSMREITQEVGYKSEGMTRKKKHQCFKALMTKIRETPDLIKELLG